MKTSPPAVPAWMPPLAPAPRSIERRTWDRFTGLVELWLRRSQTRRALAALEPERLADIGVGRAEARREAGKPFWRA